MILDPASDASILRGLSSDVRIKILRLVHGAPKNVNEIAKLLDLPQSTVATNVMALEEAGLVSTESTKASKGSQKICRGVYDEILIVFDTKEEKKDDSITVEMPIGLYTSFQVSPPCGLCSPARIIGYLDVPDVFFHPDRVQAGLLWFEKGFVEYKFPNNSLYADKPLKRLELRMELSSESLEKNKLWLSDITVWINDVETATWTSPGDFGDRRGKFTPDWWKMGGAQYGLLKDFLVTDEGAFIDGVQVSPVSLSDLKIGDHHSIKVRIGIKDAAAHVGGINIFGKGFGNYGQGIILNLTF